MNNKVKYLPILLLCLCGILNSCSNEDLENNNIDTDNNLLLKSSNNSIINDERFLSLIQKNDQLSKQDYDLDLLNQIVAEEIDDIDLFSQSLGFETTSEFLNFQEEYVSDVNYLQQTYELSEMNLSELENSIVGTGYYYNVESEDPLCDRENTNCVVKASSVYALEAVGCSALNVTLVGGLACYGIITALYLAEIDDCDIQLQRCNR